MSEAREGVRVAMAIKFNSLMKIWEATVEFESGKPEVIHGKSFKYILQRIGEELDERMIDA